MKNDDFDGVAEAAPVSGHTPGPWLIEYAETVTRWPVVYVRDKTRDGGKREIASVDGVLATREYGNTPSRDKWTPADGAAETEANAALIAAAPELLGALMLVTDAYARLHGDPDEAKVVIYARNVIAKARALTSPARKPS